MKNYNIQLFAVNKDGNEVTISTIGKGQSAHTVARQLTSEYVKKGFSYVRVISKEML